ncbi:hypothetical protein INR49_028307, partial [Caranx melampygus]
MIILFICITVNSVLVAGSSLSDKVHQSPTDIYRKEGEKAKIKCLHNDDTFNQILWYKQLENGKLQLLGYMYGTASPEKGLNVTIEGGANKGETCTLTTEQLSVNSSALYFCAA